MKNFKELRVWQKGMDIATETYELTKVFPREEKFGMAAQTTRAAVSIVSNIAEGSSRSSEKDYRRFLEIALGSVFELETQLLIAENIGYGDKIKRTNLLILVDQERKMLISLIQKLKIS